MNNVTILNGTITGFQVVQENNYNVGIANVVVPTHSQDEQGNPVNNYFEVRVLRTDLIGQLQTLTGPTPVSVFGDRLVLEARQGMCICKMQAHTIVPAVTNQSAEVIVNITNAKTGTYPVADKATKSGKAYVSVSLSSWGETVNVNGGQNTTWNSFQASAYAKHEIDLLKNIAPNSYVSFVGQGCVFKLSPKKAAPVCYCNMRGLEAQTGRNIVKIDPQNGSTTQQAGFGQPTPAQAPQGFGQGGFGQQTAPAQAQAQQGVFGAAQAPAQQNAGTQGFGAPAPAPQGFGQPSFGQTAQAPAQQNAGTQGFGAPAPAPAAPPMQQPNGGNNVGGFADEDLPF